MLVLTSTSSDISRSRELALYWVFWGFFFLQRLFICKGKSISKVLCIFSRCEVFITAFCTAICKLDLFGVFLDSTVSLALAC